MISFLIGMVLWVGPATSMEQHQSPKTFQAIEQPLSHKLAVTALGASLIAAELLWFVKK